MPIDDGQAVPPVEGQGAAPGAVAPVDHDMQEEGQDTGVDQSVKEAKMDTDTLDGAKDGSRGESQRHQQDSAMVDVANNAQGASQLA